MVLNSIIRRRAHFSAIFNFVVACVWLITTYPFNMIMLPGPNGNTNNTKIKDTPSEQEENWRMAVIRLVYLYIAHLFLVATWSETQLSRSLNYIEIFQLFSVTFSAICGLVLVVKVCLEGFGILLEGFVLSGYIFVGVNAIHVYLAAAFMSEIETEVSRLKLQ